MSKGVQIAWGAVAVAVLLGWFAWTEVEGGAFQYFQNLHEFRASGAPGEAARVHGYVAAGSIVRDVAAQRIHFAVQNDPPHAAGSAGATLPVIYASLEIPDLFKDGAEVVVEGRLTATGDFHASNVLAKCPSKFEGEQVEAPL